MADEEVAKKLTARPLYSHIGQIAGTKTFTVRLIDVVNGFAASTGMHGIPNIHNSYGLVKKAIWMLITVFMLVLCINNLRLNLQDLLAWPVSINVDITSAKKLDFPSVTICNTNPYKVSALPERIMAAIENDTLMSAVYDVPFTPGGDVSVQGGKHRKLKTLEVLTELLESYTLEERHTFGYQLLDLVVSCSYSGYDCKDSQQWQRVYNARFGNCYIFNTNDTASKFVAHQPGPAYGLELILNTQQVEYLPMVSDTVGLHVQIHDNEDMPFPEDNGVLLAPGTHTNIGIRMTDISRLGGRYDSCYDTAIHNFTHDVYEQLYPWTNYTLLGCQKTCWQSMLIDECDCYDPRHPRYGDAFARDVDVCSCFNKSQVNCIGSAKLKYIDDAACQHCLKPCRNTIYSTTVSSGLWPSQNYLPTLLRSLGETNQSMSEKQVSQNLMQVGVYYEELNYESVTESPSYTLWQFMSDIGGAIGLWLGASLMSVGEVLELLIDIVWVIVSRRNQESSTIHRMS